MAENPRPACSFPAHPLADYLAYRSEIEAAVLRVLASGRYVLGAETEAFEREFGLWLGEGARVIGVASGSDALTLALQALGVGPGDRVATVAHTAVATLAAIEQAGAIPLLVDIDPGRFTLDPERLAACLRRDGERRIKAVVPVHLYGQMADMPAVLGLARAHGAWVVEDCAQAAGARLDGRMAGLWGDAAAFSFYPTKNLSASGDAGAVATRDRELAERVCELRQYGWGADRVSVRPGRNSRLDEVQAAVLRVKLPGLHAANGRRRELAALYGLLLGAVGVGSGADVTAPATMVGAEAVFHQYVVRSGRRDSLRAALNSRGVPVAVHYTPPAHVHPAYAGGRVSVDAAGLGETERASREVLSLPMHAHLEASAVEQVVAIVREWANENPGNLVCRS